MVLKVGLLSYHVQENQIATIFIFGRSCTSTSPISKKILPKLIKIAGNVDVVIQHYRFKPETCQQILIQLSTVYCFIHCTIFFFYWKYADEILTIPIKLGCIQLQKEAC